jgi:hypothetical protein
MDSQSQIKRTLSTPVAISYVAGLLDSGEFIHRSELADFLCEQWCASETGESCGMKGIHHVNYPFSM